MAFVAICDFCGERIGDGSPCYAINYQKPDGLAEGQEPEWFPHEDQADVCEKCAEATIRPLMWRKGKKK